MKQFIAKDIYVSRDSVINTTCDLWTKVRLPYIPNVIGMLSRWQNSRALHGWWCAGSGEAQSCERVSFIKKHPL
jgi:hypothetical protein